MAKQPIANAILGTAEEEAPKMQTAQPSSLDVADTGVAQSPAPVDNMMAQQSPWPDDQPDEVPDPEPVDIPLEPLTAFTEDDRMEFGQMLDIASKLDGYDPHRPNMKKVIQLFVSEGHSLDDIRREADLNSPLGKWLGPEKMGPISDAIHAVGKELEGFGTGLVRSATLGAAEPREDMLAYDGNAWEFDEIPYLADPEVTGKFSEMFKDVSPSRAAGNIAGSLLPFGAVKMAMDKLFGVGKVAQVLASQPGASVSTQILGRTAPATEIAVGYAVADSGAEAFRLLNAGEEITADKIAQAAAIGMAFGLGLDVMMAMVPPALRGEFRKTLATEQVQDQAKRMRMQWEANQVDIEGIREGVERRANLLAAEAGIKEIGNRPSQRPRTQADIDKTHAAATAYEEKKALGLVRDPEDVLSDLQAKYGPNDPPADPNLEMRIKIRQLSDRLNDRGPTRPRSAASLNAEIEQDLLAAQEIADALRLSGADNASAASGEVLSEAESLLSQLQAKYGPNDPPADPNLEMRIKIRQLSDRLNDRGPTRPRSAASLNAEIEQDLLAAQEIADALRLSGADNASAASGEVLSEAESLLSQLQAKYGPENVVMDEYRDARVRARAIIRQSQETLDRLKSNIGGGGPDIPPPPPSGGTPPSSGPTSPTSGIPPAGAWPEGGEAWADAQVQGKSESALKNLRADMVGAREADPGNPHIHSVIAKIDSAIRDINADRNADKAVQATARQGDVPEGFEAPASEQPSTKKPMATMDETEQVDPVGITADDLTQQKADTGEPAPKSLQDMSTEDLEAAAMRIEDAEIAMGEAGGDPRLADVQVRLRAIQEELDRRGVYSRSDPSNLSGEELAQQQAQQHASAGQSPMSWDAFAEAKRATKPGIVDRAITRYYDEYIKAYNEAMATGPTELTPRSAAIEADPMGDMDAPRVTFGNKSRAGESDFAWANTMTKKGNVDVDYGGLPYKLSWKNEGGTARWTLTEREGKNTKPIWTYETGTGDGPSSAEIKAKVEEHASKMNQALANAKSIGTTVDAFMKKKSGVLQALAKDLGLASKGTKKKLSGLIVDRLARAGDRKLPPPDHTRLASLVMGKVGTSPPKNLREMLRAVAPDGVNFGALTGEMEDMPSHLFAQRIVRKNGGKPVDRVLQELESAYPGHGIKDASDLIEAMKNKDRMYGDMTDNVNERALTEAGDEAEDMLADTFKRGREDALNGDMPPDDTTFGDEQARQAYWGGYLSAAPDPYKDIWNMTLDEIEAQPHMNLTREGQMMFVEGLEDGVHNKKPVHYRRVEEAIKDGREVRPEVLEDYPSLQELYYEVNAQQGIDFFSPVDEDNMTEGWRVSSMRNNLENAKSPDEIDALLKSASDDVNATMERYENATDIGEKEVLAEELDDAVEALRLAEDYNLDSGGDTAPRTEATEAGQQGLIAGTGGRQVPMGPKQGGGADLEGLPLNPGARADLEAGGTQGSLLDMQAGGSRAQQVNTALANVEQRLKDLPEDSAEYSALSAQRDALRIEKINLERGGTTREHTPFFNPKATKKQRGQAFVLLNEMGIQHGTPEYKAILKRLGGVDSMNDLTVPQANKLISGLMNEKAVEEAARTESLLHEMEQLANRDKGDVRNEAVGVGAPEGYGREVSAVHPLSSPHSENLGLSRNEAGRRVVNAAVSAARSERQMTNQWAEMIHDFQQQAQLDVRDKHLVAQALDGQVRPASLNEVQRAGYEFYRDLYNEIAQQLGLPPDRRVAEYFPHLFPGSMGKRMSAVLARDLDLPTGDIVRGTQTMPHVPTEKMFRHLFPRTGEGAYMMDLDKVTWAYLRGASRKINQDPFLAVYASEIEKVPNNLVMKSEIADYARAVSGGQHKRRVATANRLEQSDAIKTGVESLIEWVAPPSAKGSLKTPESAIQFIDNLARVAQEPIPGTDIGRGTTRLERTRARVAMGIDEIFEQMKDPRQAPWVANNVYRAVVWQRLGLNVSWGLLNYSELLTNVMPGLNPRRTATALFDYLKYRSDDTFEINGHAVRDIVKEFELDEALALDHLDPTTHSGWSRLEKVMMSPGRIPERQVRAIAALGAFRRATDKGMNYGQAKKFVEEFVTKHKFFTGKEGSVALLRNPLMQHLLMFQSWSIHEVNMHADLFMKMASGFKKLKSNTSEQTRMEIVDEEIMPFIYQAMAFLGAYGLANMTGFNFHERIASPAVELADAAWNAKYEPVIQALESRMGLSYADAMIETVKGMLGENPEPGSNRTFTEKYLAPQPAAKYMSMERRGVSLFSKEGIVEIITGARPIKEGRRKKRPRRSRRQRQSVGY